MYLKCKVYMSQPLRIFNVFLKLFGVINYIQANFNRIKERKKHKGADRLIFQFVCAWPTRGFFMNKIFVEHTRGLGSGSDFWALNRVNRISLFKYPEYCPKGHEYWMYPTRHLLFKCTRDSRQSSLLNLRLTWGKIKRPETQLNVDWPPCLKIFK